MQGIKVIVEAVDRVTAPIRRIGGSLRNINLAPLRDQLGRVVSAAKTAGAEIGRMAKNVALGVSGLAVAAGALMMNVMRRSNEAAVAAERVGISMRSFQGLSYATQTAGGETADMADAMKDLNLKILEALNGNDDLRAGFRRMGVDLRDANGNIRSTEDIFVDLADAFAAVPDGAKKSAAAIALMGEAGLKMIPMLNRGSDSLRDTMEEAERLGLVLDDKTAAAFKAISLDMIRLQGAATGLQNTIASKLLPVVQPLVQAFTDWIVTNRELIATNVLAWMEELPALMESAKETAIAWTDALAPLTSAIGAIVDQIGPMNASLGFLSILVGGKLIPVLIPLIRLTWMLGRAFTMLTFALARMAFGPVIASIGRMSGAIRAATGAMTLFNLALLANPIVLTIAAIVALAGAAYLIYQNWDSVGPWFGRLWDSVERRFSGVVEFIKGVFTLDFQRAWDGLKEIAAGWRDWIVTIWTGVYGAFDAFVTWLDEKFGTPFGAVLDAIEAKASGVVGFLQGLWAPVQSAWQAFADWVSGKFGPLLEGALGLADRLRNLVPGAAAVEAASASAGAVQQAVPRVSAVSGAAQAAADTVTAPAEAVRRVTPSLPVLSGADIRELGKPMSGADLNAIGANGGMVPRRMSAPDEPLVFGNGSSPWGGGRAAGRSAEPEKVDHGGTIRLELADGLKVKNARMNDDRFSVAAGPHMALS